MRSDPGASEGRAEFVLQLPREEVYVYYVYMGKPATLSDEAYAALTAQKQNRDESLSQVILRFVPRPIRTFGDLEKHLENLDGPVTVDYDALERIRKGRRRSAH